MTELEPTPLSAPRRLLRTLGVNRAVGYTLAVRGLDLAAKPVTLYLSLRYLSLEELGYFYTFGGVLALQVFFELGIGTVTQQFFSYEASRVAPGPDGRLHGDPDGKGRVASLFYKCVVWHGVVAVLVATLAISFGHRMFSVPAGAAVEWQPAWVLTVLASAATVCLTPISTLVVGLGDVTEAARVVARSFVAMTATNWILLVLGYGLLAAAAAAAVGLVAGVGWMALTRRRLIADVWHNRFAGPEVSWRREIWPFQWRIAVSWLSGYFIFQLFTPVTFAFYGPRAAARVGFTLSLIGQVQSIGLIWLNTRIPRFGVLIARKDYARLDAEFRHTVAASVAVVAAAGLAGTVAVWLVRQSGHPFADRLLPAWLVGVLALNCVSLQIVSCLATYLRGHRREPLLVSSVVSAAAIGTCCWVFGRYVGYESMLVAYVAYNLFVGLPWVAKVFADRRAEWRSQA